MTANATSRIKKFLAERARVRGLDPEQIMGLHEGDEREALLTTSDLRELLDDLALAQAQRDAGNRRIEQMTDELTRLRTELENEGAYLAKVDATNSRVGDANADEMEDRALLERAAEAIDFDFNPTIMTDFPTLWGCFASDPFQNLTPWNPLADEGDRHRLLVRLKMTLAHEPSQGGWSVGAVVNNQFHWLAFDERENYAVVQAVAAFTKFCSDDSVTG